MRNINIKSILMSEIDNDELRRVNARAETKVQETFLYVQHLRLMKKLKQKENALTLKIWSLNYSRAVYCETRMVTHVSKRKE